MTISISPKAMSSSLSESSSWSAASSEEWYLCMRSGAVLLSRLGPRGSDLLEGVTTLGKSTGDEGAGRGSTTVNMVLGSSRGGAPAARNNIGYRGGCLD